MAAYPGFAITKSGRAKLIEVDRKEAERTGQVDGMANDPVTLVKEGAFIIAIFRFSKHLKIGTISGLNIKTLDHL